MCSQNAGNVISEPPILKISPGPPLESLSMNPPPQTKQKLYAYDNYYTINLFIHSNNVTCYRTSSCCHKSRQVWLERVAENVVTAQSNRRSLTLLRLSKSRHVEIVNITPVELFEFSNSFVICKFSG